MTKRPLIKRLLTFKKKHFFTKWPQIISHSHKNRNLKSIIGN